MKKLLYTGLIAIVCLSACKKDKDDDTPSGVIPYSFSAPKCLLSTAKIDVNGDVSTSIYQYDGQRRLISITEPGSAEKTTYAYAGNTILESETAEGANGDMVTTVITHYLNATGFVARTVGEDSTETFYTYDTQGYLIREVSRSFGNYSSGVSYQYSNGNKATSYSLSVDGETGKTGDSTLAESYFYYENMPGKMEEYGAWIERKGRANKNELKSINGGFSTSAYEYIMGNNGMPATLKYTFIFGTATMNLVWNCN
jgi:YD repeat-containing protein